MFAPNKVMYQHNKMASSGQSKRALGECCGC